MRSLFSSPGAPTGTVAPPRRHRRLPAARMERRIRRLRPSADAGGRHPRGGGEFPQLPREPLAAGAAPQRAARGVRQLTSPALTPDLRIMDLLDSQPEFTKAVWEYLDILVTDARIADGRAILAKHRAQFDAMEKAYGVDRHIIAAIWGIESNYGTRSATAR